MRISDWSSDVCSSDLAAPIDRMIDAAQDRLDTIAARLSSASAHTDRATTGVLPEAIVANPATTPARFADMVAAAKDYLAAGDISQVVLSQCMSTPCDLPPFHPFPPPPPPHPTRKDTRR